jgi:hypothetical protein
MTTPAARAIWRFAESGAWDIVVDYIKPSPLLEPIMGAQIPVFLHPFYTIPTTRLQVLHRFFKSKLYPITNVSNI